MKSVKSVRHVPRPVNEFDSDWRRFERELARRERLRYIRQGRILPAMKCPPQLMIMVDGAWRPEIRYV